MIQLGLLSIKRNHQHPTKPSCDMSLCNKVFAKMTVKCVNQFTTNRFHIMAYPPEVLHDSNIIFLSKENNTKTLFSQDIFSGLKKLFTQA